MAAMSPILRLQRAFRALGLRLALTDVGADDLAEEAADAISEYGYDRHESDLRFSRMMAEMRWQIAEMHHYVAEMAEIRNQIVLAIMLAAGLIIGAVGLLVAFVD
ncbi:MAG: hypothetical protein OXD50_07295 [Chloroflexi bacterium]|nr:hypothetical protein [Chloroflexota bacterium]